MPILFPNSKSSIIGLSNKVSIISRISLVPDWQVKMFFSEIACTKIPVHQCIAKLLVVKIVTPHLFYCFRPYPH